MEWYLTEICGPSPMGASIFGAIQLIIMSAVHLFGIADKLFLHLLRRDKAYIAAGARGALDRNDTDVVQPGSDPDDPRTEIELITEATEKRRG